MDNQRLLEQLASTQVHMVELSDKALKHHELDAYTFFGYCAGLLHTTIVENTDEEQQKIYDEARRIRIYRDDHHTSRTESVMATESIADMTVEELEQLIDERIDHRTQGIWKLRDNRSNAEILASIRKRRFTPPEGAKSTLELLREDRDA